jgi:hypothetical protein
MTKLIILLTGYLLFGQPTYSVAQRNVQLQVAQRNVQLQVAQRNVQLQVAQNEILLGRCCEKIMRTGPCLLFPAVHNGKMRLRLLGVYSHGPTLFFLLRLNNRSPLDYDIDSIRFCIAGREGSGPPSPAKALVPVYIYDSATMVPGYRRATTIYAVPRFTLPPDRRLLIIVREKNGGRHLRIQAGNGTLERARLI